MAASGKRAVTILSQKGFHAKAGHHFENANPRKIER